MNPNDPTQPNSSDDALEDESFAADSAYEETPVEPEAAPDETNRPKSFREVLKDKRFWMTVPVLVIALASTGYFLTNTSKEPPKPLLNNVNVRIPNAQTDSVPKSKLELQAARQRAGQPTVGGMQTEVSLPITQTASPGLPASLEPFMYRQRPSGEPVDPELAALDSLYSPEAPARHRPVNKTRVSSRPRSMPSYLDTPLPDEFEEETARPRDVQKQVEDRQRLLALLTEYKRDKEARAAAAREGERPHKVESGVVASTLGEATDRRLNGFYGLYSSEQKRAQEAALTEDLGTIRAVIHQDQQITDGGRVQLRLLEPVTIREVRIPANTLIYGVGSFGAERVTISLNSIQYEGSIFPIKLTVHDMDGMPGVYVPNVLAAQEGKQVLGGAIGGASYNVSGHSATNARAAAAMAGISAAQSGLSGARGVLQRKITQQKATLKGNYYVLLK